MLPKKIYTLVFLRRNGEILLGLKKRGFGVNKWNGFGGKVEPEETIIEAAARELLEECCVKVNTKDLKNIGHLEFTFQGEPLMMDVRVYSTNVYEGIPKETEEMAPKWLKHEDIPYNDMWPDDKLWFPYMFQNKLFYGKFNYEGYDKILDYNIQELQCLEAFHASRQ